MQGLEKNIIHSVWLIAFISIWFIPKGKRLEASFIFLFTHLPTWVLGLLVVEFHLIEYPVRELSKANSTSFTFEYFIMPIMCIFFNLHFPKGKKLIRKAIYCIGFTLSFAIIEAFAEKHTLLIKYIDWHWYYTLISMMTVFCTVRVVHNWFFSNQRISNQ